MNPVRQISVGLLILLAVTTAACSASCVETGHVGVVTTFGAVTSRQLGEGLNFVAPWQGVHELSVRTREIKETAATPSNEGLTIQLEVSLLYRLAASEARTLYQTVGADYADVIVVPSLRSAMRAATAAHKAEALYSEAREQIAVEIRNLMEASMEGRGILIERVLLRDIQLPTTLKDAIEAKQGMEQESLRMQFVLAKERQEAERKRVEAQGIKDFQDIVSQGISDRLLQWKGIEATENLAQSANSKIVIIGSGSNGLPIILGGGGD
ncbi:MAG: prohibitin family protein [Vicinamibacterales bacterium]